MVVQPTGVQPTGVDRRRAMPGWRPPRRLATPSRLIMAIVVGVGIAVSLAVGEERSSVTPSATPGSSAGASADARITPDSGTVGPVDDIAVGDCIILPTEGEFSELRYLPCTSPHEAEVFFLGDQGGADDPFPDDAAFEAFVVAQCHPAFAAYTGRAYDAQTELDVGWFTPTEAGWVDGDRSVSCYLAPAGGAMTSVTYRDATP
jgi:hypothetical protein